MYHHLLCFDNIVKARNTMFCTYLTSLTLAGMSREVMSSWVIWKLPELCPSEWPGLWDGGWRRGLRGKVVRKILSSCLPVTQSELTDNWQLSLPGTWLARLSRPDSSLTRGSEGSQALSTNWLPSSASLSSAFLYRHWQEGSSLGAPQQESEMRRAFPTSTPIFKWMKLNTDSLLITYTGGYILRPRRWEWQLINVGCASHTHTHTHTCAYQSHLANLQLIKDEDWNAS